VRVNSVSLREKNLLEQGTRPALTANIFAVGPNNLNYGQFGITWLVITISIMTGFVCPYLERDLNV
jgi:hypothetical protein